MARITVEDCLENVDNQFDLVLLAKERAFQLNSGATPQVPEDDDKRTVISLREIAENKISVKDLEETAIKKLRKHVVEEQDENELEESENDDFEKIYKGESSKSGSAILPTKRLKRIQEKMDIEAESIKNESIRLEEAKLEKKEELSNEGSKSASEDSDPEIEEAKAASEDSNPETEEVKPAEEDNKE